LLFGGKLLLFVGGKLLLLLGGKLLLLLGGKLLFGAFVGAPVVKLLLFMLNRLVELLVGGAGLDEPPPNKSIGNELLGLGC